MSLWQPPRSPFCAGQIVQYRTDQAWLLAEVIETVTDRDRLWLRPLLIAVPHQDDWKALDLREDSQLLVPSTGFEAAEDIAAIGLLCQLPERAGRSEEGRLQLRSLLQQLTTPMV